MIDLPKDWRDEYHYGAKGERLGWTRARGAAREEFTFDGALVASRDAQGRPATTAESDPTLSIERLRHSTAPDSRKSSSLALRASELSFQVLKGRRGAAWRQDLGAFAGGIRTRRRPPGRP